MKEIDLSKAPEGATHYRKDSALPWRMLEDGEWYCWEPDEENWIAISDPVPEQYFPIGDRPDAAWTGEGLPPVGAMVEIRLMGWSIRESAEKFIGIPLRVAASFRMDCGTDMIAVDGGHDLGCEVFRAEMAVPARTPEQIAAEEREKAIEEMLALDPYLPGRQLGMMSRADFCRALHDAGYRKVTP